MKDVFEQYHLTLNEEETEKLERYYHLLVEWNDKMNLTSIVEKQDVIWKHFLDSALIMKSSLWNRETEHKVLDVGTMGAEGVKFANEKAGYLQQINEQKDPVLPFKKSHQKESRRMLVEFLKISLLSEKTPPSATIQDILEDNNISPLILQKKTYQSKSKSNSLTSKNQIHPIFRKRSTKRAITKKLHKKSNQNEQTELNYKGDFIYERI